MARGAHREAFSSSRKALGTLRHLPETRQRRELVIDIRLDFGVRFSRSAIGRAS
jgi:hypothetical protein